MTYTLEPGDVDRRGNRYPDENAFEATIDKLAYQMQRDNVVFIKDLYYRLESYGPLHEDGSRLATLKLWNPDRPF